MTRGPCKEMKPPSAKRHILVVEDDEMVQAFIALHLENEGFEVSTAGTGGESLSILAEKKIDLILLDLNLPDGDGLSITQKVRETSSVPIIILTARKGQDDRLLGLGLGADEYLTKPIDPKELFLRVRNLLDRAGTPAGAPPPPPGIAAVASRDEDRGDQPAAASRDGGAKDQGRVVPSQGRGHGGLFTVIAIGAVIAVGGTFWFFGTVSEPPKIPDQALSPAAREPMMAPPKASGEPSKAIEQPQKAPRVLTPIELDEEEPSKSMAEVLGYGWVLKSKCDPIPRVEWWKYKTHEEMAGYVQRKHNGDWTPYIDNWFRRLVKLQDMHSRKSNAVTNTGIVLQGEELAAYIQKMRKRVAITRCLARESKEFSSGK